MIRTFAVPVLALTTAAGFAWSFQPEPPKPREGGQPGERGREGGQPGERGRGGEMRAPSVGGAMKSIGRPLKALMAQITDPAKKDENLQLINDMQRGAVMAKGAKLDEKILAKAGDAKAQAEMRTKFRRNMLTLTKTLLEVETLLLDDKLEEAKTQLESAVKMRDENHKAMGIDD
ncbi:MAG: hypothetical protein ACOYN0_01785 [Phycisphaerales bacterium]